jgi:WD40 repeat protein
MQKIAPMSLSSFLLGGVALATWLALGPFWWWSRQPAPRKANVARISLWDESHPKLTADGRFAVTAKRSKTRRLMYEGIILREVPTGQIYWQLDIGPFKNFPEFSSDGKFLMLVTPDRTAQVWDIAQRRQVGKCSIEPVYSSSAVSPGGMTVAVKQMGGPEDEIVLHDLQSGESKSIGKSCFEILFSPNGSSLAFWDKKGISIIDVRTGTEYPHLALPCALQLVVFSADGQTLFAIHDDGALRAWDIRTGSARVLFSRDGNTNLIRVAANGEALAIGYVIPVAGQLDSLGDTVVLDTSTGRSLATLHRCWDIAFGSDGKTLITAHEGSEAYVHLWDLPPRARVHWGWTAALAIMTIGLTVTWWLIPRK